MSAVDVAHRAAADGAVPTVSVLAGEEVITRSFAVLAQVVPSVAAAVALIILGLREGGLPALAVGLGLLCCGCTLMVVALTRWSRRAQFWAGVAAGLLGGLAVVPPPWADAGALTTSHAATPAAVAAPIAVTAALGAWLALPSLIVANAAMILALTLAEVPLEAKYSLGVCIAWVTAVVLIAFARRGFRLSGEELRRAAVAEEQYRRQQQRWQRRRRRDQLLHDTVLATLDLLVHDDRPASVDGVRDACRRDLSVLRGGLTEVGSDSLAVAPGPAAPEPVESDWLLDLRGIADELGAGGLDVDVQVGAGVAAAPVPDAWTEGVWAIREALRNVRQHAQVDRVDLAVEISAGDVVVTIVDTGVGFDTNAVPIGRLGLRESVRGRLERLGGSASVWSTPGRGTCVVLRLPFQAVDR